MVGDGPITADVDGLEIEWQKEGEKFSSFGIRY
jgi:hypothetical protein